MIELKINSFKAGLVAGARQVGLWNSLCSTVALDVVADSGFDWILIDTEHAPNDLRDVLGLLQVMERSSATAIVRPPANDPVVIKRLLDIGAQSLLVPFVQTGAEAEAAVAATRYPPAGIRGVTASGRASRYGRVPGYAASAAHQICVLVQVETGEALQRLEEIAAVDGVDGVFIGPADLAASLGHIGEPGHPFVQEAIRAGLEKLAELGKPSGILARNEDDADRYLEWGASFIAVGSDVGLLANAADRLARRFRDSAGTGKR